MVLGIKEEMDSVKDGHYTENDKAKKKKKRLDECILERGQNLLRYFCNLSILCYFIFCTC